MVHKQGKHIHNESEGSKYSNWSKLASHGFKWPLEMATVALRMGPFRFLREESMGQEHSSNGKKHVEL